MFATIDTTGCLLKIQLPRHHPPLNLESGLESLSFNEVPQQKMLDVKVWECQFNKNRTWARYQNCSGKQCSKLKGNPNVQ
jgi:hypothetical protein